MTVSYGGERRSVLFDFGISPDGCARNLSRLGRDTSQIDAVACRHGHFDHAAGLATLADELGSRHVPFVVHPDFWQERRLVIGDTVIDLPAVDRGVIGSAGFVRSMGWTRRCWVNRWRRPERTRSSVVGLSGSCLHPGQGDPGTWTVLWVYGPGSVGKSTLLGCFADDARRSGARVVRLDAREVATIDPDRLPDLVGQPLAGGDVVAVPWPARHTRTTVSKNQRSRTSRCSAIVGQRQSVMTRFLSRA